MTVGHINLLTKQGSGDSSPSKEGGSSRRFCYSCCFPFTSFPCPRGSAWYDDELLLDSTDLRLCVEGFLGLVGLGGGGGAGQGVSVSRRGGGGFARKVLRRLGGFNPQLHRRISSSAQPSHPNSPRLAQHGVLAAQVSVRRRDPSHSRNTDTIEDPRCGLRSSS